MKGVSANTDLKAVLFEVYRFSNIGECRLIFLESNILFKANMIPIEPSSCINFEITVEAISHLEKLESKIAAFPRFPFEI
jgi:hypothetical protein